MANGLVEWFRRNGTETGACSIRMCSFMLESREVACAGGSNGPLFIHWERATFGPPVVRSVIVPFEGRRRVIV